MNGESGDRDRLVRVEITPGALGDGVNTSLGVKWRGEVVELPEAEARLLLAYQRAVRVEAGSR